MRYVIFRIFIGFLPATKNDCLKKLNEYKAYPMTMVFYEAPHRIRKCLENMMEVFGDRNCCLARELTKLHEEFIRGKISEVLEVVDELKGEMVVVVEGDTSEKVISDEMIIEKINELLTLKVSKKDAIKQVAKNLDVNKNYVYDLVNKMG